MVKKSDWKTIEMPPEYDEFTLERVLSEEDIMLIKEGYRPQEMEDKWFMYFEENKLFIHRSWTGFCVYIVEISDKGTLHVLSNRNQEQRKETDCERDKIQLNILINNLVKKNSENSRLMKEYIERLKQ